MTTNTWTIEDMERDSSTGGVKLVHWKLTAVSDDSTVTVERIGSCGFSPNPDAETFTAYDDLTEEQVIAWVKSHVNVDIQYEEDMAEMEVRKKLNPLSTGKPW